TLELLDRRAADIADVFLQSDALLGTPIRVCLRGTDAYVYARDDVRARVDLWPPLLEAELEQMERGDIPYFFRLYGEPGIHYYGDPSLATHKTLPLEGDVPQLEPLLPLDDAFDTANRVTRRGEGLVTLLGAFDHPSFTGLHRDGDLEVSFAPDSLTVGIPSGEELECPRDLGAFVSSVYLPCRCGEVGTVFVPEKTTCSDQDPP
ncbi:MAG: hypothetical protein AAFY88_11860, partial [Acidobacteriota bacterium]